MIAGIIFGALADASFLKATIIPPTFLMVYPMMINLQIAKVFAGGDFKLQAITQIINFAVVPFFAFGIDKLFFSDRYLGFYAFDSHLAPVQKNWIIKDW